MEITATIAPNEIAARHNYREGFGHHLTIDVPNGWEDVKKLTKKVLRADGRAYTFIGWNSDRNEMFFRENAGVVATISAK